MDFPRVMAASLAAAAMALAPAVSQSAGGSDIFKKGCASCHYVDGPAKEKSIADQLAKKGPELWYAGSKFQKAWLVAWLQDPKPIRPLAYNSISEKNKGDHPKSSAADAQALTDYLMTLTSPAVTAGAVKPGANVRGRATFTKKMPCTGCHVYGKEGQGGQSGPSLAGASKRLNPDWILAYLANTKTFKPVRDMPDFGEVLNAKDLQDVAAYVASFE